MSGATWPLGLLWIGSVIAVAYGSRPVSDRQLTRWATRFDVVIAEDWRSHVSAQLRRVRTVRWGAIVVGTNLGAVEIYVAAIDLERAAGISSPLTKMVPFAAAALGAIAAELSLARPSGGVRSASLAVRRWTDYIDIPWIVFVGVCLPVSLAASVAMLSRPEASTQWVWLAPVGCVLAVLAITAGINAVVDRPAVSVDVDHRHVDDALRADSAHHIVGAAVALAGVVTSGALMVVVDGPGRLIPAVIAFVLLGVWFGLARTARWSVETARLQRT